MTRRHFSKSPIRRRRHAGVAKLRQLRRLSEDAPEDGLEDWMAASGGPSSGR
jgi:hypothetical protein